MKKKWYYGLEVLLYIPISLMIVLVATPGDYSMLTNISPALIHAVFVKSSNNLCKTVAVNAVLVSYAIGAAAFLGRPIVHAGPTFLLCVGIIWLRCRFGSNQKETTKKPA